jgi:hypothetical protein
VNSSLPGWAILTKRYGADIRSPSEHDLAQAIDELLDENLPGMTEGDYAEHPNAFLRYGHDDGPMYIIDLTRERTATFLKYADQDEVDELCNYTLLEVTRDTMLELWTWLAQGRIDQIVAAYPSCGW